MSQEEHREGGQCEREHGTFLKWKDPGRPQGMKKRKSGLGRGQVTEITVTFLRSLNFYEYRRKPKTGLK